MIKIGYAIFSNVQILTGTGVPSYFPSFQLLDTTPFVRGTWHKGLGNHYLIIVVVFRNPTAIQCTWEIISVFTKSYTHRRMWGDSMLCLWCGNEMKPVFEMYQNHWNSTNNDGVDFDSITIRITTTRCEIQINRQNHRNIFKPQKHKIMWLILNKHQHAITNGHLYQLTIINPQDTE